MRNRSILLPTRPHYAPQQISPGSPFSNRPSCRPTADVLRRVSAPVVSKRSRFSTCLKKQSRCWCRSGRMICCHGIGSTTIGWRSVSAMSAKSKASTFMSPASSVSLPQAARQCRFRSGRVAKLPTSSGARPMVRRGSSCRCKSRFITMAISGLTSMKSTFLRAGRDCWSRVGSTSCAGLSIRRARCAWASVMKTAAGRQSCCIGQTRMRRSVLSTVPTIAGTRR